MRKLLALGASFALFLSACGGGSGPDPAEDPKASLISAMENTGQMDGIQLTMSLDADAASMSALAASDGDELAAEDAEKIINSSIVMRTKGKGDDAQFEMVVNVAGEPDIEMRVVDKVLYARADVPGLMETFGQDPAQLDGVAEQAAASGMTFVGPALDGEWLAVKGLEEFAKQFTGGQTTEQVTADQEKIVQEFTEAMEEAASVTHEGDDDYGAHLAVTIPLRDMFQKLVEMAQELSPGVPLGEMPPESEIPDEDIVLDVWVDDDRVTRVLFDFLQIGDIAGEEVPEGVERFGFLIAIDEFGDDVEVPEGAVEVDAQQVLGGLMTGMMGGMSGSSGTMAPAPTTSFDCSQLEGQPPEVTEQFADVCPGV